MKWKTTLVLLTVVVGVGAYVSQVELKQPLPEQRQGLAKRIVHLSSEEITSFSVDLPDTKVTLKKEGDAWRLIVPPPATGPKGPALRAEPSSTAVAGGGMAPLGARAERSLIQRILGEVSWLDAERVLAGTKEQPLDRAPYGLSPAKGTLVISTQHAETTLLFGNPSAVGDNRYLAHADRPEVFVAGSSLFDALNQPAESYRSHALVDVNTAALTSLTVSSPTVSYALAKERGQWQLTQPATDAAAAPPTAAADAAAVGTLLSRLSGLRIERFLDEQAEVSTHPEWGFQTPSATFTLTLEGQPTPLEILIGGGTSDNAQQRYAKRSDEPTLYAISGAEVEPLLADPQTLRAQPPATEPGHPAAGGVGDGSAEGRSPRPPSAATPSGESAPPAP